MWLHKIRHVHTYKMFTEVTARCMCNLESEWPAHNQGKTLG